MSYILAAIFDMDGLIIDSEPVQSKSYEAVLKEYGKEPDYHPNGLVQLLGIHAPGNWEYLKDKHDIDESIEVLLQKKHDYYAKLIKESLKPMPGLLDLLGYLKSRNIVMAVASSSSPPLISLILTELKIRDYFKVVVSGEEVAHGKPAPDIFLKAASKLGIKPANCLVLEDAETGVVAGKAAGMKVIAVQNSYTSNQDHSKADVITDSLVKVNATMLESLS